VAKKSHYYPTPCTALWGEGEGGSYLYGTEKRELLVHLNYHQNHTENDIFNENL
jgi:hypothetical protein